MIIPFGKEWPARPVALGEALAMGAQPAGQLPEPAAPQRAPLLRRPAVVRRAECPAARGSPVTPASVVSAAPTLPIARPVACPVALVLPATVDREAPAVAPIRPADSRGLLSCRPDRLLGYTNSRASSSA